MRTTLIPLKWNSAICLPLPIQIQITRILSRRQASAWALSCRIIDATSMPIKHDGQAIIVGTALPALWLSNHEGLTRAISNPITPIIQTPHADTNRRIRRKLYDESDENCKLNR